MIVAQVGDPAAPELGLWVAAEKGLFAKHGLDVELTRAASDTQVQLLISGQVQFVAAGPAQLLTATAAGAEFSDVARLGQVLPWLLVSRPDIRDAGDLRGKKLGVSGTGVSASRAACLIALREMGLDPSRDGITLVPAGGSADRLAALAAGGLDATVVLAEQAAKIEPLVAGGKIRLLADLSQLPIQWANEDLIVSRAFARDGEETIDSFLRALVEAHVWLARPENRNEVLSIAAKYLEYDSPEKAAPLYDLALRDLSPRPYPSTEGLQVLVDALSADFPELATVSVKDFADPSFVTELDRNGYIDSVIDGN